MLFVAFISWWYGEGWRNTVRRTRYYLTSLARNFSIGILLKTLFVPWKQIDAHGWLNQSLADKFRHGLDKFVSRFVGFGVRSLTLLGASLSFIVLMLLRVVWIIIWPVLPLLVPIGLLYGLGIIG